MKKWIVFFLIVAALLVGANSYAPTLAEAGLYAALSSKFGLHNNDIHVQASPGAKIFLGDMDAVTLHAENIKVGDLKFSQFDCNLYDVTFDPLAALLDHKVQLNHAQSGEMTASVRSDELEKFLAENIQGLDHPQVSFENDAVRVAGDLSIGGLLSAHADVRGHFGMQGHKLMFIPSDVSIEGMGVKYNAKNLASAEIYDFSKFPLGIQPDSVTMRDGVLTIHGQVSNS